MAYIKYKEMTPYFNFKEELAVDEVPQYVMDYLDKGEEIKLSYKTSRDKFVLTDRKLILFDVWGLMENKTIHFFPFKSISSSAIEFKNNSTAILLTMDSGYQLRLNFVNVSSEGKTRIRSAFMNIINKMN